MRREVGEAPRVILFPFYCTVFEVIPAVLGFRNGLYEGFIVLVLEAFLIPASVRVVTGPICSSVSRLRSQAQGIDAC